MFELPLMARTRRTGHVQGMSPYNGPDSSALGDELSCTTKLRQDRKPRYSKSKKSAANLLLTRIAGWTKSFCGET